MSKVKRAKGGEYKSRPDNVIVKNGEYYTKGTQPPDPPPEKKKEKEPEAKDPNAAAPATDPNAAAPTPTPST